jgi:predicted DNA-binding protein
MGKDTFLNIRVSSEEVEKLRAYAKRKGRSMASIVRDYISRLPTG